MDIIDVSALVQKMDVNRMNLLKRFVQDHKVAIFFAVLVSIIVAFPQIYFRIEHIDDGIYQGIELLPDSPRSALTREVMDGHPRVANVYYKDGKDGPYLWQPLQPMVVAYMGKIFSLDINDTLLLSRFVLTFFTFLLIYFFTFLFSRDKFIALCGSSVLLLADSLLSYAGVYKILHGVSPDSFLRIASPVNPAMIFIPFFAFLITFWLFYKKGDWRFGVASAIILGLNFYNYFYSWTWLYSFGGILVLSLLFRRKWHEATRLSSVFIGGLVIAIPYFINLHKVSLYPTYAEASARFGVVLSHAPTFVGFTVILALVIFLLGFPKEDKEKFFFGLALLLTPFITQNQQILTGKILQPAHYHWFYSKPLAFIFVLIVFFHLLNRWGPSLYNSYKKPLAAIIIVVSVFTGIFTQVDSYLHDSRDGGQIAINRQRYGLVMKWLSENAQKEAVVFGNDETSHLTVIYTPLNVFYHRVAMNSLTATKERLLDVLFTIYRLRGVGVSEVEEVFFAEPGFISWNLYGIYYRELLGSYGAIPDEKIEEAIALYKETLSVPTPLWLQQVWSRYEVEYLVWDKKTDPLWRLEKYPFLKEVAVFGDLSIYKFSP